MRQIENDGISRAFHNLQRAHIHYQIPVAEACPAFRQHYFFIAGAFYFFDYIAYARRRQELAFFDVDDFARFAGRQKQIRLTAEKCRYLQNIGDFCGLFGLPRFVNIGKDGRFKQSLGFCQNPQAFFYAGASV